MSAIVQSLDYGNGLDLANTFTQDYELNALTVKDGLTGITDAVVPANNRTFAYTATNRLNVADGPQALLRGRSRLHL